MKTRDSRKSGVRKLLAPLLLAGGLALTPQLLAGGETLNHPGNAIPGNPTSGGYAPGSFQENGVGVDLLDVDDSLYPSTNSFTDNRLTITGSITGAAYGGINDNNPVFGNLTLISGGQVGQNVYGGLGRDGDVLNNTVRITGAGTVGGNVYGGYSAGSGNKVYGNLVEIGNGVSIAKNVYGGYGMGQAGELGGEGNTVRITGGEVLGSVYGGRGNAGAYENKVEISGGKIHGDIYAAVAAPNGNAATVSNNSVTISGTPDLKGVSIHAGNFNELLNGNWHADASNTLKLDTFIGQFEHLRYFREFQSTAGTLAVITGSGAVNLYNWENNGRVWFQDGKVGKNISIFGSYTGIGEIGIDARITAGSSRNDGDFLHFTNHPNIGEAIRLQIFFTADSKPANHDGIEIAMIDGLRAGSPFPFELERNYFGCYRLNIVQDRGDEKKYLLTSKFDSNAAGTNTQAAVSQIYQSSTDIDVFLDQVIGNAIDVTRGDLPGVVFQGEFESEEEKTSCHINVRGTTQRMAAAWNRGNSPFTTGIFASFFQGRYGVWRDVGGPTTAVGDLDTNSFGMFLRYRPGGKYSWSPGPHATFTARYGHSRQDFLCDALGGSAYERDVDYMGLSFSCGYVVPMSRHRTLDLYGDVLTAFYVPDGATDNLGQEFHFSGSESVRVRLGSRYRPGQFGIFRPFLGVGLQHDFVQNQRVTVDGYSADKARFLGTEIYSDLGVRIDCGKHLVIGITGRGILGRREGGGAGSLDLAYRF